VRRRALTDEGLARVARVLGIVNPRTAEERRCETCGARDTAVRAGGVAFCADCLDVSRDAPDDPYRDTGGGD
jgi:hypothetical protein